MVLIQSGEFNNSWVFGCSSVQAWTVFDCGFFYLEIVASVSTQNILLSSNDLENLLGDAKDKSFLSFDRTVSRILGVLSVNC